MPEVASWNKCSASILLRDFAARNKQPHGSLTVHVASIIPGRHFGMNVVSNIVVSMKRLGFSAWTDPHGYRRVNVWLRDRFLPVVSPPEPTPCSEEVFTDFLVERVHQLSLRVCRAQVNKAWGTLGLL